jgi:aminodeoxyfutalosine deaminase
MKKIAGNLLHNGHQWLPAPSTIIVEESTGKIIDILHGQILEEAQWCEGIVCPGFINAHCHLELSYLYKQVPQHTGLIGFLENINQKRHDYVLEEVLQTIALAEEEMIRNGIVAVGDICNTNLTILQKQKRKVHYHNFIEIAGVLPHNAEQRWQLAEETQNQFIQNNLVASLVPHAPYSVSEKMFSLFNQHKNNSPISIHNQECEAENQWIQNGTGPFLSFLENITQQKLDKKGSGESSLQWMAKQLQNVPSLLLVHNTITQLADIETAKIFLPQRHWVLCPLANLYIENTLPTCVPHLQTLQENICLGTDSLASNTQLSIYEEMLALQQGLDISLDLLIQYATANGAKALQLNQFGSLQINTSPGILHLQNCTNPHTLPLKTTIQRLA